MTNPITTVGNDNSACINTTMTRRPANFSLASAKPEAIAGGAVIATAAIATHSDTQMMPHNFASPDSSSANACCVGSKKSTRYFAALGKNICTPLILNAATAASPSADVIHSANAIAPL